MALTIPTRKRRAPKHELRASLFAQGYERISWPMPSVTKSYCRSPSKLRLGEPGKGSKRSAGHVPTYGSGAKYLAVMRAWCHQRK